VQLSIGEIQSELAMLKANGMSLVSNLSFSVSMLIFSAPATILEAADEVSKLMI